MSCPTCDCTMQSLQSPAGVRHFWCERCGTLKTMNMTLVNGKPVEGVDSDSRPALVSRVRKLVQQPMMATMTHQTEMHRLGIFEAIALPEERPNL